MRFSLQARVWTSHTAHGKMYVVKLANTAGTQKKEYLLWYINQLQKHRKKNNIIMRTGTHILKNSYLKDEKGNLLTDTHSILCTSKNHFCQLHKLYVINIVMQTKILAAEPLAQVWLCDVSGVKIWYFVFIFK